MKDKMALKASVESLFERYVDNKRRLKTWYTEEAVKDWVEDYRARVRDGGVTGVAYEAPIGDHSGKTSLQERLMVERHRVIERMDRLQLEVNLTELLMLYLSDAEIQMIRLRYFEKYSVPQICSKLYISKSSFYRNCSEIFHKLTGPYCSVLSDLDGDEKSPFY